MYRLMVVEDDPVILESILHFFTAWGYEARAGSNFDDLLPEFLAFEPHLLLLDLKLPSYGGYHWCREIRKLSTIPILFITSAGDSLTAVTAMNLGADDLIQKPFDLNLLGAKVEALLRRAYGFQAPVSLLHHRGLSYSPAEGTLSFEGQKEELTRNESRILQTLLEHKGQIVSRELLMTRLWETDSYVDDNTLTVNVARLRRKLEQLGAEGYIHTRKGQGYQLE